MKVLNKALRDGLREILLNLLEEHQKQSHQNQMTLSELHQQMRQLGQPFVSYETIISVLRGCQSRGLLRLFLLSKHQRIGLVVLKNQQKKTATGQT